MKIISVFNNKGGVGKTTLTFHLACALAEMGLNTLLIDLDPQCSLTIHGMDQEGLHSIWEEEDPFIDDYKNTRDAIRPDDFKRISSSTRSIHFLLKPTEDGIDEAGLSRPFPLNRNLDLIPGRLSMHLYENKIASRWNDCYQGDPLAIRTITRIRNIAEEYASSYKYDFVIIDTSPSLGTLNKTIISTADGFLIPCMPDMFSLYGIKNIGNSLRLWHKDISIILNLVSEEKQKKFPKQFVRFLGFTIFNARKYTTDKNPWNLAQAHYNFAKQIPDTVKQYIPEDLRRQLNASLIENPIGVTSIMHSHSTMPSMAQKYRLPIWNVPSCPDLEPNDKPTITGNRAIYEATKDHYIVFAVDLLTRLSMLG